MILNNIYTSLNSTQSLFLIKNTKLYDFEDISKVELLGTRCLLPPYKEQCFHIVYEKYWTSII